METSFPRAENPSVSVVIRVRNEARSLERVFQALSVQTVDFGWEVVIVDNESTDTTPELCQHWNARRVPLATAEFSYGRAINVGIEAARGQYIVLLSAHALPVGKSFLKNCIAPFEEDEQIAAVRCIKVSSVDEMMNWYAPEDIRYATAKDQTLAERNTAWINKYPAATCCALRRSVWSGIRFDESLEANEDKLWVKHILAEGFAIRNHVEAFYFYLPIRRGRDQIWHDFREQLALYRITGQKTISWPEYFYLSLRAFVFSPLVAVRYFAAKFEMNTLMVLIPILSHRKSTPGSFSEFNKHR